MTRKEGFIEVDKMLQEIGVDTTSIDSILESPQIWVIDNDRYGGFVFSFRYQEELFFYKHNYYYENGYKNLINPYNEVFIHELAIDFGIPCVDYDLAVLLGSIKGNISKNYKKKGVHYIKGEDIIQSEHRKVEELNNLKAIWDCLEYRYQNHPNKEEIIFSLVKKIVSIYLFDILVAQSDRGPQNWEIMESDNNIDIAPLYDNERVYPGEAEEFSPFLGVDVYDLDDIDLDKDLYHSISRFQKISSSEFTDIIKDKLWIISEENLHKVFDRIEKKTGYPMPEEEKEYYLSNYQEHKRRLEEILGLTVEREEHNERKNR